MDLCLGAEPPEGICCSWLPLFRDEIVAWVPKEHALASAKSFPMELLKTEPFIHTSPDQVTDQDIKKPRKAHK